jgi:hypothetical protein
MKRNNISGSREKVLMRRVVVILLIMVFVGCAHTGASRRFSESQIREYSSAAVALPDFSMKIKAYYETQKRSIPGDFDAKQFFEVLEKKYPDQSSVKHIKDSYKVSVRPLEGGLYSVMLCDPTTDKKIMEDISCHLNYVEIKSWEKAAGGACLFEDSWKPYCQ